MKIQNCLLGIGVIALLGCGDERTSDERVDGGDRALPPVAGAPSDTLPDTGASTQASESTSQAMVWAVVAPISGATTSDARGTIRFEPTQDGLRVEGDLEGLPPGKHAIHVHQGSDCDAPGEHFAFNPEAQDEKIAGNLGEISVDSSGRGEIESVVRTAQIDGTRSIVGRSVVVHAQPNDPTSTPDGGAGPGIACGVIQSKQDISRAPLRGVGTKQ